MEREFHTAVLGGGALGTAAAIAIQRRLRGLGLPGAVLLLEKSVLAAGLSARHSGIVRSANADRAAAALAARATRMWRDLTPHWGVSLRTEQPGAVWIARADAEGDNPRWQALQQDMGGAGVDFSRIDKARATALCGARVRLGDDEVFYHEPDALQLDPGEIRAALYRAVALNGVEVREHSPVLGFERAENGQVSAVLTEAGRVACSHVINACGPWSPTVLAQLGLQIPVSVEPVAVANWLVSPRDADGIMPIIADYTHLAYFRTWGAGEIHMHQPRKRSPRETARAFADNPLALMGADFVTDPANQTLGYAQVRLYEDIMRRRFFSPEPLVFGSGYRSYFDITPDLKFILGPDPRVPNLIHCLGAGQSLKYAPVFGEAMADFVTGGGEISAMAESFNIARFDERYMAGFWSQVAGRHHSLAVEEGGL